MNKLEIKLENCFWIKKLIKEFDFTKNKANVIYSRNGLMKTSFSKVFKKIQDNKIEDIKDEIFGNIPVVKEIKIDNIDIAKDNIFVIKSFENFYESESIASLLINDWMKDQLEILFWLRDDFLKKIVTKSDIKISQTLAGKTVFSLEPTILKDFDFKKNSFLQHLEDFDFQTITYNYSHIKFWDIFDSTVLKKIESPDFQTKIEDFLNKSDEIYSTYNFLDKWKFTLAKLKEIQKRLKSNNFFVKGNKIILDWFSPSDLTDLDSKIRSVEKELHSTSEFKAIEKLLSDAKGMILKDIIESNSDIIEELKIANLSKFRKKLWLSYMKYEENDFNTLKNVYISLKSQIESLNIDETPWKDAINIFNNRFTLPFKMEIDNLTSSIIWESLPKVVFSFCKDGNIENTAEDNWKKINRDELEWTDTLSQWEKRALYLLNIIFDIEKIKKENKEVLFVIDDIADSFDYKNKYAIVEYLRDISVIDNFYMIILSHNFDFYRTISSRLDLDRENKFHAIKINDEIKIEEELYQDKPFKTWTHAMKSCTRYGICYNDINAKKHIIALIPFVRNLVEYWDDKGVNDISTIDKDHLFLTNLIHLKDDTPNITFWNLKKVYKQYLWNDDFDVSINDNDKVYTLINSIADNILDNDVNLEDKIILAIAIRLEAERFMKDKITNSLHTFTWIKKKVTITWTNTIFLEFVKSWWNQTRLLFNGYEQIWNKEEIKILESVNIMTPENIHLNSFMYEPILDMDIIELKSLHWKVKALFNPC